MARKIVEKVLRYNAIFEPAEEGGFVVTVPKLAGLVTEGDTFEEAMEMVKDAIRGYLEVLQENKEEILLELLKVRQEISLQTHFFQRQ